MPEAKAQHLPLKWLIGGGVGALLVAGLVIFFVARSFHSVRNDLVTHKVQREVLELTIVERGALESTNNSDITCRVKSGTKNSTVATTIKWVIDDGSRVKKDDPLVELDDSGLIEQLKNEKITLDTAESAKIQAEQQYKITVSQNESDIQTAETNLELAKIDLTKYREGDFPQALKDVEGRIKVAESDLEQQKDRNAWAQRMVKKGYQTVSQAQSEQSRLDSLQIALDKVLEEKRVLIDPAYGLRKRTETDLANKVAICQQALSNTQKSAIAKDVKDKTDRETKTSIYNQELTRYKEIEDEIKKCKIYSPQDGMVVYFVPEQARNGGGSQQSIIAQGEPVREGQKLMQIPDLHKMMVNTKVHEALVSRVNQGQKATVRIDAFPDRIFDAHVEQVATISSQQDFWAPDVKVYTTKVVLDGVSEGLKPGMSAEVKITVGDPLKDVLTIPVESIVGSAELGGKRKCFVLTRQGPEERDIVVGMSNDRVAEVREGLSEGEEVVLNPVKLAGDKKVRQAGKTKDKDDSDQGKPAKDAPKAVKSEGSPTGEKPPEGAPGVKPDGPAKKSPEDRQKQAAQRIEEYKKATPERRKQMIEEVPEAYRSKFVEKLKAAGLEVPE
jgi:multidrug resistance efflux pump